MADKHKPLEFNVPITEITSDASQLVRISPEDVESMTEGDETPLYAIVAIDEGKSNNNFIYDGDLLVNIAEQINNKQPVGYLGHTHMEGKNKDNLLPDPQVVWAAATVVDGEPGKKRLLAKGYLLPGCKARDWLKRKAINSVSWSGDAIVTPVREGGYKVREFLLESIDFSRKNKEGMSAKLVALVTEMEKEDGGVTAEEIKALQLVELETHNPELVALIKSGARAEAEETTRAAVTAELETKHQAEIAAIPVAPEIAQMEAIKTELGVEGEADPVVKVTELKTELSEAGKTKVLSWFDGLLKEKVPNERARKVVAKMVPVTEMSGDYSTEAGREALKQTIGAKVDDIVDNDEDIKIVIKEMASNGGGLRLPHNGGGNNNDDDDEGVKSNDNIEVRNVKV